MAKELWDAYDRDGNPLGFDLVRDEPMPEGAWHLVAVILAITTDGRVLVTKRHPDKAWGGYWEITGGSVLKGETPIQGALRELREETGIAAAASDLHELYTEPRSGIDAYPTIYHTFWTKFDPAIQPIQLQEGETVEYRLIPSDEFEAFVLCDEFTAPVRQRFLDHWDVFGPLLESLS